MKNMTISDKKPNWCSPLKLIKKGNENVLSMRIHWNMKSKIIEDINGNQHEGWKYDEEIIEETRNDFIPKGCCCYDINLEPVFQYIQSNQSSLIEKAKIAQLKKKPKK